MAAVPAPATPPWVASLSGPRPGGRLLIRPQPTTAPRVEAMTVDPLWRREPVRAVARGPTLRWRAGGTTGGKAAAALRLRLVLAVAGTPAGGSFPPPALTPPLMGKQGPGGLAEDMSCLTKEQGGSGTRSLRATLRITQPRPPGGGALPPFDLQPDLFAHGAWTKRMWTARRPGTEARACGPGPPCPSHGAPVAAPWPRLGSLVGQPGRRGVCASPEAAKVGQLRLRPGPPAGLLPRVLRLPHLLAGAWNGWWLCRHWPKNKQSAITAVDSPRRPEFGAKGATVGQTLQWRYLRVLFAPAVGRTPAAAASRTCGLGT